MPFEIKHHADQDYIEVVFSDQVTMQVVHDYIAALLPVLEETGCKRLLSDSREAIIQFTSRDIRKFPEMAEASPLTAQLKRAVLVDPGTSGYGLYEILSRIQGHELHVFFDKDEAMRWLSEENPPEQPEKMEST